MGGERVAVPCTEISEFCKNQDINIITRKKLEGTNATRNGMNGLRNGVRELLNCARGAFFYYMQGPATLV